MAETPSHIKRSSFSRPALLKALRSGDKSAFSGLLETEGRLVGATENDLRIALQTATTEGKTELVEGLLQRGAKTDLPGEKGTPPLLRAVDKGYTEIVRLLLRHKAAADARDKHGRTALMLATLNGHNKIIELLLQYGANVDAVDLDGRTVLLNLAAETSKSPKWNQETIKIVLATRINLEHLDKIGRTALQWSAALGKVVLAAALLNNMRRQPANIRAATERGRTPLHLAAENNQMEVVKLLLDNNAETEATSDGYWTPLLNAAQNGHEKVVDLLLNANAAVNARTSSGMTSLHWACENGHLAVVKRLLKEGKAMKNPKDGFDSTPLSRAGQHGHQDIIQELRPHIFGGSLSPDAEDACHRFNAAIVDFFFEEKLAIRNVVKRKSVWECLYGLDSKDSSGRTFAITTLLNDIKPKAPDFRWIHLPANNVAWAEALITKFFLEREFGDPASFKAMLRLFGQRQHRGRKAHSRFMRPLCQRIGGTQPDAESPNTRRRRSKDGRGSPVKVGATRPLSLVPELILPRQENVVVLFMPYLHFETDTNRSKMSRIIKHVEGLKDCRYIYDPSQDKDVSLIAGYLNDANLHIRRTLDQFKHHSINTEKRDTDQVVYRYCKDHPFMYEDAQNRLKVFMVDQLWVWILNNNLVFTCFPERWGQPKRDTLNLFDAVIEDINSKTRPPVRSVYELAALITDRCSGTFDRHQWSRDEFRFMEMFELSIGTLTRRETALFRRFEADSAIAAHWLKTHDKARYALTIAPPREADAEDLENEEDEWLRQDDEGPEPGGTNRFVDRLLNIAKEARLLVECKDIQDELGILTMVLRQQKGALHEMDRALSEVLIGDEEKRFDLSRKLAQQKALVDLHLLDIERMDKQAKAVNISLTQVLDLKQKHANALEARFTRDQAHDTARQGQTIMVFTIVTIIFLPMSFMAAFFTINIVEFPQDSLNGGSGIHLSYVAKYIFGVGFGISIPLITIAFVMSDTEGWLWSLRNWLGNKRVGDRTVAARRGEAETGSLEIEKSRPSIESWRYRPPSRHNTGGTERSRRTQELGRASPV